MTELLREYWDWFLFDTLVWTGALIALVMVLRRPVARHFGAGAAYALWFLPLARLVIPPFTLPAWMRPVTETVVETEPAFALQSETIVLPVAQSGAALPTTLTTAAEPVDFLTPLLLLWLGGAMVMLVRRFWLYFALRRELLEDARPVGEVGSIRLIETSAISGPMAFGVLDRVIALPNGFMSSRERAARDLAIAHELSHHRGGDLIVNMLVQPLFAIHWFNPLGHIGWNALRRDQEAFCDARVVAARSHDERATYANVIADFARRPALAPRPALAAPMACPVLGDKSIIHRLRSLSMSDISPRRRLLGRGALASAFLAVPLTASICYAEGTPTLLAATAQAAETSVEEWTEADVQEVREERIETEIEVERELAEAEREVAEAEREVAEVRREIVEIERELAEGDERRVEKRRIRINGKDWDKMSEADRAELRAEMAKLREQFAEGGDFDIEMKKLREQFAEGGEFRREMRLAVAQAGEAAKMAPEVVVSCKDKSKPVTSSTDAKGKTTLFVCETAANELALQALKSARTAIASESSLSAEERAEALRSVDAEIAELQKKKK
ncbi:M56 family metallopeptidase [Qipengyuania sp. 1NDW9]|uniref:M56 family metallopeptidase n=1 Tax=Qipengyuania xiapuensis TaxID=2867236 RepID=UPI001C87941C|nr:M56 family metallopeptidase [Qipengyuania xiapuensis]MBX7493264.1 M56 family metallopeptidase [Qipengyuania xiapuensis]